ncbi:MAG: pitrilysin family protein [Alphaproteobacteria bacterium]|nr:pitrilysin family protein [Alphaproteobacteria bacterium]
MTIQITELDNGLRIATDTMEGAESVVLGAWVGVGTRHEPWRANGVAHLVEHMMFKGTKTRSSYALSSAIENKGGDMNAHTSREETAYYARVLPEEAENAIDIISDMLRHSVFAPKELDRERQVVIQEIGRDLDSPEDYVFDLMHLLALPGQKIGRSILGTADVIAALPRSAIADYVARYYVAANMVVVAAGKITHEAFVAMVKKRFAGLPRGKKPVSEQTRVASGAKLSPKEIEQVHLILGFAGPGYHARASYYATQVLSLILGGSASSRLFQKVREKRGLVYTINSAHMAFSDAGIFQIYAGTDPKRLRELVPVVCGELGDIRKNVTRGELARAKAQVRADLLMGKESVMRRAEIMGHQILAYGKPIPAEKILERLLAVTPEDVQNAARKVFAKKPILTALGPLEELEDYGGIAARLKE